MKIVSYLTTTLLEVSGFDHCHFKAIKDVIPLMCFMQKHIYSFVFNLLTFYKLRIFDQQIPCSTMQHDIVHWNDIDTQDH